MRGLCAGFVCLDDWCSNQLTNIYIKGFNTEISEKQHAKNVCTFQAPSSIIWYPPRGVISLTAKVGLTVGLVESNGSLPPDL